MRELPVLPGRKNIPIPEGSFLLIAEKGILPTLKSCSQNHAFCQILSLLRHSLNCCHCETRQLPSFGRSNLLREGMPSLLLHSNHNLNQNRNENLHLDLDLTPAYRIYQWYRQLCIESADSEGLQLGEGLPVIDGRTTDSFQFLYICLHPKHLLFPNSGYALSTSEPHRPYLNEHFRGIALLLQGRYL